MSIYRGPIAGAYRDYNTTRDSKQRVREKRPEEEKRDTKIGPPLDTFLARWPVFQ